MLDLLLARGTKHCAFIGANHRMHLLVDPILGSCTNVGVGRRFRRETSKDVHEIEARRRGEHRRMLQNNRLHRRWHPEVGQLEPLLEAVEPSWHDADHFKRRAINRDCLVENSGIRGESMLPEMKACHCYCTGFGSRIISRCDGAAHQHMSTENAEVVAGNKTGGCELCGGIGRRC